MKMLLGSAATPGFHLSTSALVSFTRVIKAWTEEYDQMVALIQLLGALDTSPANGRHESLEAV